MVRRGDALTSIGLGGLYVFMAVKICVLLFAIWHHVVTVVFIPQRHQLEALVPLASLRCHKAGECAKSCVRRSVCLCSQIDGYFSIRLLT